MFDNRTLIIGDLLIPFAFMLIQLIEYGWSEKQAVKDNIKANFFLFIGYFILLIGEFISLSFISGISNLLIFISIVYIIVTTFKLFGVRVPRKRFRTFVSLLFVTFILCYILDSINVQYFIYSIVLSLLCFYGVFKLLTTYKKSKRALLYIISVEFILLGVVTIVHYIICGGDLSINDSLSSTIHIVESSLFILVWNYTVQLQRNAIVMADIEKNSSVIYQIQDDLSILNHIFYEKDSTCNIQELYEQIFDLMKLRFNINKAVLFIKEKELFSAEYSIGFLGNEIELIAKESRVNGGKEAITDFVGDLKDGPYKDLILTKGLIGGITYPLYIMGNSIGSLFVGITSSSTIVNRDREVVLSICRQAAGIIHNAQMHNTLLESQKKLKEMSSTDHLTGVYNRREFFTRFTGELNSAVRHGDSFTLFMLDIDSFSNINDEFGLDAGDQVLISVADVVGKQIRANDLFARYGGEVFIGVLLRGDSNGAVEKLHHILNSVRQMVIPGPWSISITASVGCVHFSKDFKTIESMIKRADIALYKAKKLGRNILMEDNV